MSRYLPLVLEAIRELSSPENPLVSVDRIHQHINTHGPPGGPRPPRIIVQWCRTGVDQGLLCEHTHPTNRLQWQGYHYHLNEPTGAGPS